MKKIITTIIVLTLLITFGMANITTVFGTTEVPTLVGETAILIDAKTGTILYDKKMNEHREPASTTKMITGLLAIEKLPLDKVVTIDAETPFTEGSRIYLMEGEEITVEELLYALFLESANDAAVALAKEIGGSVEKFAVMMNERAAELGAKNTNFINPNGLHLDGHVTTAYDLSMIAKGCMENKVFRKFVSTYQYTIQPTNKQVEPRYMYNTNRLLYDTKKKVSANGVLRPAKYEGVTGIKTGYTSHAGGCLTSAAERGETELIAVVLKSTDLGRFGDSIALLDWGFENYHSVKTVAEGDDMGTIKVTKGKEKTVSLVAEKTGYATLALDKELDSLTKVIKVEEKIEAPVKEGQVVGTVDFFQGDVLMASTNVVTSKEVPAKGFFALLSGNKSSSDISEDNLAKSNNTKNTQVESKSSMSTLKKVLISVGMFAGIIVLAMGILFIIRYINIKKRKKKRAERAMKIAMEREMDKLYCNKEKVVNR